MSFWPARQKKRVPLVYRKAEGIDRSGTGLFGYRLSNIPLAKKPTFGQNLSGNVRIFLFVNTLCS